jgi:WXXGXW repeat (2 copies)
MKKQILAVVGGLALAASMSMSAGAQVHIRIGPPAPVHEEMGRPPHEGWVWQPGYHRWDGEHYVWVGGTWAEPPHHGARWVPGHWDHRHGEYVWVEGHWR